LLRLARAPGASRSGPGRQELRRELECQLRRAAVGLADRLADRDWQPSAIAGRLGLSLRRLRHWQQQERWGSLRVLLRGRPTARSPLPQRQQVLACLAEVGPGVGVPSLCACFPLLSRAELTELLARYRRAWRRRHGVVLHRLHWTQPGSVWAMDFACAPRPVEGLYPYLLAVRDLASGQQLCWLPLPQATGAAVAGTLGSLFAEHGPPLVLKSDNGSAFYAGVVQQVVEDAGVIGLYSPPARPQYNGGIEAAIGMLKARTECQAVLAGHPGEWSWLDVEAARQQANTTARPRGLAGPSPEQLWRAREAISAEQRQRFQESVARWRQGGQPEGGAGEQDDEGGQESSARERQAIQRALVEHGLLYFTRRRIPSPIPRRTVAIDS